MQLKLLKMQFPRCQANTSFFWNRSSKVIGRLCTAENRAFRELINTRTESLSQRLEQGLRDVTNQQAREISGRRRHRARANGVVVSPACRVSVHLVYTYLKAINNNGHV